MQLLARRVSPQALPVGRRPRGYAKKTGKNFQKRVSGFQGGAIPGSRSRDQPDSGGGDPRIAIARSAGFKEGGTSRDRERAIGRIPGGGKGNSRIGIARSAGFQRGDNSRIAIARSAEFPEGEAIPGSRSRDRPDSGGGQIPDRDRANGQIPGRVIPGSRSRDRPDAKRGGQFPDRDRAIGRIPGGRAIPGSRSRNRLDSERGQFRDRDRAISQIPGGCTSRIAIA